MTPQEKLKKIESGISDKYHHVLDFKDASWLIARVEQLEEAIGKAYSHCQYTGEGHYELGTLLREARNEGPKPGAQE